MSTTLRGARTLQEFYETCLTIPTAITPHLQTIRHYASKCEVACEFGVKKGFSSSALLMGASVVHSWDIVPTREAQHLQQITPRWNYHIADSRDKYAWFSVTSRCDLLLLDSLHTYEQVKAELELVKGRVDKYLIFHDWITFGSIGADGESGRQSWTYQTGVSVPEEHLGIMPAILGFMAEEPEWDVLEANPFSHGLLVLKRRG